MKDNFLHGTADIANEFNNRFAYIGSQIASQIKVNSNYKYAQNTLLNSFVYETIGEKVFEKEKQNLSNQKAVLKSETLKQIKDNILTPFTYILNRCVEEGLYLNAFKKSLIIP